jgi:hypothetical protein
LQRASRPEGCFSSERSSCQGNSSSTGRFAAGRFLQSRLLRHVAIARNQRNWHSCIYCRQNNVHTFNGMRCLEYEISAINNENNCNYFPLVSARMVLHISIVPLISDDCVIRRCSSPFNVTITIL